jgi:archaellum component FlaF (FlaF/FlaG flagellin family)
MKLAILILFFSSAWAQTSVVMSQYGPERTAANLDEHLLRPSNVNAGAFGKLFSRSVDDSIYALPLIVPNLNLDKRGRRNVMFVATMGNTVYAFDADDPTATQPYWSRNLGTPTPGQTWIGPAHLGILSTPCIDLSTGTLYTVAKIQNTPTDQGFWVFALDIVTGSLKYNSPRRVDFPFAGGPTISNVPDGLQRAGLLVSNGTLYVAFASIVPDADPHWHQEGFVQAFNASNLQTRLAVFQTTPTGDKGGIWQAGRGVAADALGIYIATAAGTYDGTTNFGSSAIRFAPGSLQVQDWFTPYNWPDLLAGNIDLSANGVTLIPNTSLMFAGGKSGIVYLLKRDHPGRLEHTDGEAVHSFPASVGCGMTDCAQTLGTAFWSQGLDGMLYVWDRLDILRSYHFTNGSFITAATFGPVYSAMNGGPSVSAEGGDVNSGIVWATTLNIDDPGAQAEGTLHAFLGSDVGQELYNSDQNFSRDGLGFFTKFAAPVVANGRVYVPTQNAGVSVYGPLCGVDITARIGASIGALKAAGKKDTQQITITNNSAYAMGAPFDVVLDGLPSGATVSNATSKTACATPASPYIRASSAPLWLPPGASVSVTVEFSSSLKSIPYTVRVLTGSGAR